MADVFEEHFHVEVVAGERRGDPITVRQFSPENESEESGRV